MAYLAGALKERHNVRIFDLNVLDWNEENLIETIKEQKPDIVCFSMKSFNLHNVMVLAEKKKSSRSQIDCGRSAHNSFRQRLFEKDNGGVFDFGYQGEGDVWFARFCENFHKPQEYARTYPVLFTVTKESGNSTTINLSKILMIYHSRILTVLKAGLILNRRAVIRFLPAGAVRISAFTARFQKSAAELGGLEVRQT